MAMIGYVSFNYLDGVVQAFFTCITTSAFSSCRRPLACSPNESCFSHRMTQLPSNTIWLPVTKLAGNRTPLLLAFKVTWRALYIRISEIVLLEIRNIYVNLWNANMQRPPLTE